MRFGKRIKILPGVHLNFSKKGVSTTIGGKGVSVNIGKNGTYLNTGIPGTGISDRKKIQSYETSGGCLSFYLFIIGLVLASLGTLGIIGSFSNNDFEYFNFSVIMALIGLLFLTLIIINHQKAKRKYAEYQENIRRIAEAEQKILEIKLNAVNEHELFEGAKIFTIDCNNIIAFSKKRYIALFTAREDNLMKVISVDNVIKINQEIKAGDCYAHIYTDDFENNVYDLYIGNAHGKEETEQVRKLYNDIKGIFTALKKSNGE